MALGAWGVLGRGRGREGVASHGRRNGQRDYAQKAVAITHTPHGRPTFDPWTADWRRRLVAPGNYPAASRRIEEHAAPGLFLKRLFTRLSR